MKRNLLIILILFSLLAGCKKNIINNPLPPPTQIGANTMGCYVNGKPFIPDTKDNGSIPRLHAINAATLSSSELIFDFYRQRDPDDKTLTAYLKDFVGTGTYNMTQTSRVIGLPGSYGPLNSYFYFSDDNIHHDYVTNEDYTGSITIKYFNPTTRIVSGTFEFKGQNLNGSSDSVIVTDGRFDCKLY